MSITISMPTTDQRTDAPVRTDAEQNLWVALRAHPNTTSAFLSGAAEIGRSTAAKILARWASDGSITRTPGIAQGGQRAADLWAIPTPEATVAASEPTADEPADLPIEPSAEDTATDPEPADADEDEATSNGEVTGEVEADTDEGGATSSGEATSEVDSDTDLAPADPEPEQPAAEPSEATGEEATSTGSGDGEKVRRMASGALRGLVEDHLRDHPGEEFSPHAIAKALGGKSAGAVNNALERLTAAGTAVKSSEKPKTFTLASGEHDTARDAAPS